jgi:hypothetical protein
LNSQYAIAPVAVFAFNRPFHFQKTLSALAINDLAARSDVFVYLDGPRTENDCVANKKIQEICNGVNEFRSLTLVRRDRNYGLASSIISGVTELCESHGRVIVLEDDLLTAPFFLKYMNDALNLYQNEEAVASIHGYVYPIAATLPETFFLRGADCWGWGTWKRAWDQFEANGNFLLSRLRELKLEEVFNFGGSCGNLQMLEDQIAGRNNSWAIRWHASAFVKNMLTLYPGKSLVNNIGHDSSGTHCESSEQYNAVISNAPIILRKIPAHSSEVGFVEFQKFFLSLTRNESTENSQKNILSGICKMLGRFIK